jgi:hypothetical protein
LPGKQAGWLAADLLTSGPDHLSFDRSATSVGTLQGS